MINIFVRIRIKTRMLTSTILNGGKVSNGYKKGSAGIFEEVGEDVLATVRSVVLEEELFLVLLLLIVVLWRLGKTQ